MLKKSRRIVFSLFLMFFVFMCLSFCIYAKYAPKGHSELVFKSADFYNRLYEPCDDYIKNQDIFSLLAIKETASECLAEFEEIKNANYSEYSAYLYLLDRVENRLKLFANDIQDVKIEDIDNLRYDFINVYNEYLGAKGLRVVMIVITIILFVPYLALLCVSIVLTNKKLKEENTDKKDIIKLTFKELFSE